MNHKVLSNTTVKHSLVIKSFASRKKWSPEPHKNLCLKDNNPDL